MDNTVLILYPLIALHPIPDLSEQKLLDCAELCGLKWTKVYWGLRPLFLLVT